MNAQESGQAFLNEVLAGIPEEKRGAIAASLEDAPELVAAIGAGALRQAEFSRSMDGLKAVETQQKQWWETHQPLAELGQKAKVAGFDPAKPGLTTPALPDNVVLRDDLDQREAGYADLLLWSNTVQARHIKDFGEVIDLQELAKDPRVRTIGLKGVYEATVAPKYQERTKLATEAEIKRQVDEQVAQRVKVLHNPNAPTSPLPQGSPLDALKPLETGGTGIDELTDAYHAAVAASGRG